VFYHALVWWRGEYVDGEYTDEETYRKTRRAMQQLTEEAPCPVTHELHRAALGEDGQGYCADCGLLWADPRDN
jgi:hypothetical protein